MTSSNLPRVGVVLIVIGMHAIAAAAKDPPGKIALLPGYKHEPLQGIDSIVGKISKAKGLLIQYDIGRIRKPGGLALGGDFADQAKALPAADRQWYMEQRIAGQPVHLAHSKRDVLFVTYPESGVNFTVTVRTPEEMAEALLMLLSHRSGKE